MINLIHNFAGLLSPISPGPNLPQVGANTSTISDVLGIVWAIVGAFALLVITISGLRYITAAGNAERVSKAKNGIIYAMIGLVVAISGEAIVVFVLKRL